MTIGYNKSIFLVFPLIIYFLFDVFIQLTFATPLGDIIYKLQFLTVLIYYLIFVFIFFRFRVKIPSLKEVKVIYLLGVLFIIYNIVIVPLSFFEFHSLKYFIQDFFRGSIFFITTIAVILFFNRYNAPIYKEKFVEYFIKTVIVITLFQAIAKVFLLSKGIVYGGGLNQFMPNIIVLTILLFAFFEIKSIFKKLFYLLLFFVLIALGILSLKRGNWIEILFYFLILVIFFPKKQQKIVILLIFTFSSIGILFLLKKLGLWEFIVERFEYTFEGTYGLDSSSLQRFVESKGVLYSLSEMYANSFLIGAGNGALYIFDPEYSVTGIKRIDSSVYHHHIHSMIFLILFRLGIIGVIFYLLPIILVFYNFLRARKIILLSNKYGKYFFIFSLTFVCDSIQFIKGNALYGSIYYALLIVSIFISLYLFKRRDFNEKENTNCN